MTEKLSFYFDWSTYRQSDVASGYPIRQHGLDWKTMLLKTGPHDPQARVSASPVACRKQSLRSHPTLPELETALE